MPRPLALVAFVCSAALSLVAPTHAQQATATTPPDLLPRLLPAPREVASAGMPQRFQSTIGFEALRGEADRSAAREFVEVMRERGVRAELAPSGRHWPVEILRRDTREAQTYLTRQRLVFDPAMEAEGYILVTTAEGATLIADSDAGVFYGLQTLKQLFAGAGEGLRLHFVTVRDWPAMRWRGVHDDLSRGPVPTLEYQKRQIRLLAAYKVNVFSPYFEHTLQFASHPLIAPPGGGMSRSEVQELVAYAKRFHMLIIPEQQTFGHLHHALKQELYAPLAETPHGHVLAPDHPGSLTLTRELFAEIDSLFPGPFLHLGADETFELGKGQTKARVERDGIGPVYLRYLADIEAALRRPGRRFLFWGDIAMNHPALVTSLPQDLIAVAWSYERAAGFERFLKPYTDAGMETWVAPGVNNWNRVWPNYAMTLPNIQGFAREGQAAGSTGLLNTTWDDNGDALFEQTWYGLLFGAAAGWQPGESSIPAFQRSFGLLFHGDTTGLIDAAHRHLTEAQRLLQSTRAGDASSYLFFVDPFSSEGVVDLQRLRPQLTAIRVQAESAVVKIMQARQQRHLRELSTLDAMELGARRIDWIGAKFQTADEIVTAYAKATEPGRTNVSWVDLAELSGINGRLQDMRDGYVLTRELFERSWRAENRPYWLQNNLARYDAEILTWVQRINAMDQARRRFSRDRVLPTPEELGIPRALLPAPPAPPEPQKPAVTPAPARPSTGSRPPA